MKGHEWLWSWVEDYSDIGPCIELSAVYDDALKKDGVFTDYAVKVAQEIIGNKVRVTFGKWGARLESDKNKKLSRDQLEQAATYITSHPSWEALRVTTSIFTHGYCYFKKFKFYKP